jgi:hypothetical protein
VYYTVGFIESVERMRSAGLTLTPTAMASMDNQWRSNQPISDQLAWINSHRRIFSLQRFGGEPTVVRAALEPDEIREPTDWRCPAERGPVSMLKAKIARL